MSTAPATEAQTETDDGARNFLIGAAVGIIVLTVALKALYLVFMISGKFDVFVLSLPVSTIRVCGIGALDVGAVDSADHQDCGECGK